MLILLFSQQHDNVHKKYPSKAKLYCNGEFHEFSFLDPMDIEHLLPYIAQNETNVLFQQKKNLQPFDIMH